MGDRERMARRRDKLHQQLGAWVNEKEAVDREKRAIEEKAKAAAMEKENRVKSKFRADQKAKLKEWWEQRAAREIKEAEIRRLEDEAAQLALAEAEQQKRAARARRRKRLAKMVVY